MSAALLLAQASAPVTRWPERLLWTALTLAVVVGVWLLMLRGWRRRAARQAGLPPLPEAPRDLGADLARVPGVYVCTTTEGDWLDRVVARGLGVRSRAVLTVGSHGALFSRQGAPDLFLPASCLRGVRLESGIAGKFVERDGLVVVTWELQNRTYDTGFRTRRVADRGSLLDALNRLVPEDAR